MSVVKNPLIKRRVRIHDDAQRANGERLLEAGAIATITRTGKAGKYRMKVDGFDAEISLPMTDFTVLPDDVVSELAAGGELRLVQISEVVESRTNPRTYFDTEFLDELAASIKVQGVLQPIVARPLPAARLEESFSDHMARHGRGAKKPGYEVVLGHQRLRAANMAGLRTLRVLVLKMTDSEALIAQLVENLKRRDLHAIEEAEGYQLLMAESALTMDGVAEHVGKTTSHVRTRLKLLDLGPEGRSALISKSIRVSLAQLLARVPGPLQAEACKAFTQTHANRTMSVAEAQDYLKFSHRLQLREEEPWANAELFIDPNEQAQAEVAQAAARLIDQARERGLEVVEGKAAKAILPAEGGPMNGYVDLDEVRKINGREQSLREALHGQDFTPMVLVTSTSRALEIMPASTVGQMLVAIDKRAAQAVQAEAEVPSKAKLAELYERTWRPRAIEALWVEMRDNIEVESDTCTMREIALILTQDMTAEQRDLVARLLEVGEVAKTDGIRDAVRTWSGRDDILALVMLLVMVKDWPGRGSVPTTQNRINAIAADMGRQNIVTKAQKAVKAEMTAQAKESALPAQTAAARKPAKTTQAEAAAGIAAALREAEAVSPNDFKVGEHVMIKSDQSVDGRVHFTRREVGRIERAKDASAWIVSWKDGSSNSDPVELAINYTELEHMQGGDA
ncbi:ParB/RepB/Spo0J family partition protein [Comamonas sp. BIGb0124]|uniref:ParB/RepB/Spo0J family partition protein n=1 Tax=Comamonas sp. BIGb0124 TaxID=2485130 RepID=UPI000F48C31E|nr:ParB/RepB/Spo0J family partition protein [Comamonas sp. BIGb0124]ROR25139.1 ParB/RepB/Spo0J family partition protein [Comamonas sp. BIGb0124]